MGSAAMRAVRAAAEEARARTETSRASLEKACRLESALDGEISEAETAHRASSERLEVARKALDVALAWRDRTRKARAYASRLAEIDSDLARAADAAGNADVSRAEAVARRTLRRAECDAAREAYDRAARGVADWQTGLEELHRSAHEHRLAHRALERAREVLPELTVTGIEAALESVRSRIVEIDRERARLDADSRSAAIQREEFDRARAALVSLAA